MEIGAAIMSLYGRHKASYSNSNGQTLAVSGRERGDGVAARASHPIQSGLFCRNFSFPSSSPPQSLFPPLPPLSNRPPPLVWQCPVQDGEIGGTTRSNDPSHSTTKFLRKFKAGQLMDRLAVCTALLQSDRGNKLTRNRLQV